MNPIYKDRIARNNSYYSNFAEKVAERTENRNFSKAFELFLGSVSKENLIVDVGSGAGHHLKYFKEKGFNALGVEPSINMRMLAGELGVDSVDGTFETLDSLRLEKVGGIWAASSLLHVPIDEVPSCLEKMHQTLEAQGALYLTVRLGEGSKWDKWDDVSGSSDRFIQLFSESEIIQHVTQSGFNIEASWVEDSYWGRPSKWISLLGVKG